MNESGEGGDGGIDIASLAALSANSFPRFPECPGISSTRTSPGKVCDRRERLFHKRDSDAKLVNTSSEDQEKFDKSCRATSRLPRWTQILSAKQKVERLKVVFSVARKVTAAASESKFLSDDLRGMYFSKTKQLAWKIATPPPTRGPEDDSRRPPSE